MTGSRAVNSTEHDSAACEETVAARERRVIMLYSKLFQPYEGWYLRVYNQAKTLVDNGYEVILLSWDRSASPPPQENRDGIRIVRVAIPAIENRGPRNALKVLRFNIAMARILMRTDFDVVECFNVCSRRDPI